MAKKKKAPRVRQRTALEILVDLYAAIPAQSKPAEVGFSTAEFVAKLTVERLKEMKVKWSANKGKLKVCRKEVKSKGLVGDDRWFYIEDCMDKT